MKIQDWLVTNDGNLFSFESPRRWDLLTETDDYRLYRFLTNVEDVLHQALMNEEKEEDFLPKIRRLVRKLVLNCYWVTNPGFASKSDSNTSLTILYDEPGFPMTIQTETMQPGVCTPIHNHGTWGIVATIKGEQKNTFWQRTPSPEFPDKIEIVGEKILKPDDIISFTNEAIHCVEAVGDEPSVTLNLYGDSFITRRFQFDPVTHQAQNF